MRYNFGCVYFDLPDYTKIRGLRFLIISKIKKIYIRKDATKSKLRI